MSRNTKDVSSRKFVIGRFAEDFETRAMDQLLGSVAAEGHVGVMKVRTD